MMAECRPDSASLATFMEPVISMREDRLFGKESQRMLLMAELTASMKTEHTAEPTTAAPQLSDSDKALRVYVYKDPEQMKQWAFLGKDGTMMGRPSPTIWIRPSHVSVRYIAEYSQGGGLGFSGNPQ